jgi:predicted RNase H-like nuclease
MSSIHSIQTQGRTKLMRAVVGIDAAWTVTNPSGVALAAEGPRGWRLLETECSYQRFHARANHQLQAEHRPAGGKPDPTALLSSALTLCGRPVDLVAVDMPLARTPIIGRRFADDQVSKAYGAKWCGTHTPRAARPGRISDELREAFARRGYPLQAESIAGRGVIEVYPHPAIVELARDEQRLPYKASKVRSYWPSATPLQRRERLFEQWREIVALLEGEIEGVDSKLPAWDINATGTDVKAYEDKLDAVICAWVAICVLEGRAKPFGDEISAIWIPNARPHPISPSLAEVMVPPGEILSTG